MQPLCEVDAYLAEFFMFSGIALDVILPATVSTSDAFLGAEGAKLTAKTYANGLRQRSNHQRSNLKRQGHAHCLDGFSVESIGPPERLDTGRL